MNWSAIHHECTLQGEGITRLGALANMRKRAALMQQKEGHDGMV